MIELIPVKALSDIQEHRENYINELSFSQELHAEENVWECKCFKINIDTVWSGYVCINPDKVLWEFYLIKIALNYSQEVFKFLIDNNYITAAECKSFDHLLMSLCMDYHKKAECTAYLFRDHIDVKYALDEIDNISFRIAFKEDLNRISEISRDFFHNLEEMINRHEIFVACSDKEILGAGSCKKIYDDKDYYDIGMIVSKKHRKKGIGTFIIIKLKEYCLANNQKPICGCWYYNYGSRKTLEKAGFITKHRIIRCEF